MSNALLRKLGALALLPALLSPVQAQVAIPCGSLLNHYGPYDYRVEKEGKLSIVERSHFTPEIESLADTIRGHRVEADRNLNYTLLASPNHHRALVAVIRLADRLGTTQVPNMDYSVECFLERGLRFQPNDTVVRALYARYLGRLKRPQEATALLDNGLQFAGDNPMSHYNFGLVYFEIGDYERALKQAHRAQELGYSRTELQEMLKKAGKWRDPTP